MKEEWQEDFTNRGSWPGVVLFPTVMRKYLNPFFTFKARGGGQDKFYVRFLEGPTSL